MSEEQPHDHGGLLASMLYNVLILNFFAGIYTPKPVLEILREKLLGGLIDKIRSCKFDLAILSC